MSRLSSKLRSAKGAVIVEYALLLLLLALVTASSVHNLCHDTADSFEMAGEVIGGGTAGTGGPQIPAPTPPARPNLCRIFN